MKINDILKSINCRFYLLRETLFANYTNNFETELYDESSLYLKAQAVEKLIKKTQALIEDDLLDLKEKENNHEK